MNKKLILITNVSVFLCLLLVVGAFGMGEVPSSPTEEVEIIENIVAQTGGAPAQEEYQKKVLMKIPWGKTTLGKGTKPGELGVRLVEGLGFVPDRLAVDSNGNIYIFDKVNNRINKYNRFGKFVRDYQLDSLKVLPAKVKGRPPIIVENDVDMGVDGQGNVYILNSKEGKIRKLDANGQLIEKISAPEEADYLRVSINGKVEAMGYKDGRTEMFDLSSKKIKAVKGLKTPGGLTVVIEQSKGVNKPRQIKIFNRDGTLLRRMEIKVPYELYWVDFLGADEKGCIYIVMERQGDETRKAEAAPGKFEIVRDVNVYVRKYNPNGQDMMVELKFNLWGVGLPGYIKCFSLDKKGNIYMLAMYEDAYSGEGKFKVFKWEGKK
ncbi:MAG: hypothetical protein ABIH69_00400 [bacterium]